MAPPRPARSQESAALFGSFPYPYGSPSVESEGQNTPLGENYPHRGVDPTTTDSQDQTKGFVFHPQLTVNVYNTGGSNTGGPGVPGNNGTGGNVMVSSGDTKGDDDKVSKLAAQVASLLEKVGEMDGELKELRTLRARPTPVIETGVWSTGSVRPWSQPQKQTEGYVAFQRPFESVPAVVVSMCAADVSKESNFRVKTYVTNVNLNGFTVHANSWDATILYSCDVSWIAISR